MMVRSVVRVHHCPIGQRSWQTAGQWPEKLMASTLLSCPSATALPWRRRSARCHWSASGERRAETARLPPVTPAKRTAVNQTT